MKDSALSVVLPHRTREEQHTERPGQAPGATYKTSYVARPPQSRLRRSLTVIYRPFPALYALIYCVEFSVVALRWVLYVSPVPAIGAPHVASVAAGGTTCSSDLGDTIRRTH
jgi:hypothetical protein